MFAEESHDWNLDTEETQTCEICGSEPATVHLLRADAGEVTHTRLCHSCAEKAAEQAEGMALVLALPAVVRRHTKEGGRAGVNPIRVGDTILRCAACGTTLADLQESGLVGCSACYKVFGTYLEATVEGAQERAHHVGKTPARSSAGDVHSHEVMRLQRMLRELVECERFEEAAGVRDRLAAIGRSSAEEG